MYASFPKSLRLTKRPMFLAMRGRGCLKGRAGPFTAVVRANGLGLNRLGVTVTRKVGRAVLRNRLKRVAREFFRLNQAAMPQGLDLLLIARQEAGSGGDDRIGPGAVPRLSALMAKALAAAEAPRPPAG
jgi:ribonuclease P protein component